MYKKYDSTLLVQIDPPAIICSYRTEQKSEIIREIEVSAIASSPMDLVKEALIKGITQMREFNERLDQQYPNSIAITDANL